VTAPAPNKPRFAQTALASGLVSQADLDQAAAALAPGQTRPVDAEPGAIRLAGDDPPRADQTDEALAAKLVELGRINRWQADQLLVGRSRWTLGPYRIIDELGHGGMGHVFKAEHSIMRRIVAIKVLPVSKSTPEAIERFRREVQAQAQLDHPNLVRAYDAGQDGNVHFLVTEYVPGLDLRRLIKGHGPLGMPAAAAVICQAAKGLEHAHSRGLIHRDVKPGNLLVTPEGVCKISDLGLAGFLHEGESDDKHNKTVGTADYLAPEQIMTPEQLTPACDIYALGCTLYYAVTGKVPFPGGTTREKARRHCHEQPTDPRRVNPELEAAFVDVMADMMMKDPAQRIASAAQVIPQLRPWAGDDWPATVMSGVTKVDGSRSATPPPLPQSARPLRIAESERGDSRSHWSQGTQALGSASEETLPLDSQTGFPPHRQDDGLPRSVLIVVWLAVAAVMGVLAMMVYRTFF
jgi:serine/threonine protein kinase